MTNFTYAYSISTPHRAIAHDQIEWSVDKMSNVGSVGVVGMRLFT